MEYTFLPSDTKMRVPKDSRTQTGRIYINEISSILLQMGFYLQCLYLTQANSAYQTLTTLAW